jgi:hypothetical protein
MEKEFVPYEQALALKELGFDESTYTWRQHGNGISGDVEGKRDYYNRKGDVYTALPLYQQAFRWFREKYNIRQNIMDFIDDEIGIEWDYEIAIIGTDLDERGNYKPLVDYSTDDETRKFKTYEEAELACLIKLIEIVKNK